MESFGERLRNLREERGLTQAELGEILGISELNIEQVENCCEDISLEKLPVMASALGCSIDDLFPAMDREARGQYGEALRRCRPELNTWSKILKGGRWSSKYVYEAACPCCELGKRRSVRVAVEWLKEDPVSVRCRDCGATKFEILQTLETGCLPETTLAYAADEMAKKIISISRRVTIVGIEKPDEGLIVAHLKLAEKIVKSKINSRVEKEKSASAGAFEGQEEETDD